MKYTLQYKKIPSKSICLLFLNNIKMRLFFVYNGISLFLIDLLKGASSFRHNKIAIYPAISFELLAFHT